MTSAIACLAQEIAALPALQARTSTLLLDPAYPASLATALLYKCLLALFASQAGAAGVPSVSPRLASAAVEYVRPLSSGSESMPAPAAPGTAPVGVPMPKLEAAVQASGEARYTNDESVFCTPLRSTLRANNATFFLNHTPPASRTAASPQPGRRCPTVLLYCAVVVGGVVGTRLTVNGIVSSHWPLCTQFETLARGAHWRT